MKKLLLILGLIALVFLVLNIVSIKSSFSHRITNLSKINIKANSGRVIINTSSEKSTISGNFNHNLLKNVGFVTTSDGLNLDTDILNGEIDLSKDTNFSKISMILGSGNLNLNLKETNVSDFYLEIGSTKLQLVLPQDSPSRFNISAGSGNLNFIIPTSGKLDGIKIISQSLSDVNFGNSWVKVPDGIETKNFDKAKVTSIIDLSNSGAVKLSIDTEK